MGNIYDLHNLLQDLHPKIKFTIEHSHKKLKILGILQKNENGQVIIDIYHKFTVTQQYLSFKSHHSQNCMKFIPCTLAHRICSRVSNKNHRKTHLEELRVTLHQRGYPKTLINKGFEWSEKITLTGLRSPQNIATNNPMYMSQHTAKTTQNYLKK